VSTAHESAAGRRRTIVRLNLAELATLLSMLDKTGSRHRDRDERSAAGRLARAHARRMRAVQRAGGSW